MPRVLTARAVAQAKPDPTKRREIPDGLLPGLYLIVQPGGAKSWAIRYRFGGKPRKYTLGAAAALDLGRARDEARAALRKVAAGVDPAVERAEGKRQAAQGGQDKDLFPKVVDTFMTRYAKPKTRPSSARETRRLFDKEVLPAWRHKRLGEITKADVIELLDSIVDRGGGLTANRVLAAVRKLLNWAVERDLIDVSPAAGVKAPLPEVSRRRVLDEAEIVWFWRACDDIGYPFGPMAKLLLLTGQRRNEVAGMVQAEIDVGERLWTIPGERAKNGVEHEVPLSDPALAIVAELPRITSTSGKVYLFTGTGETPASGFSRAKARLDRLMRARAEQEGHDGEIPNWRLHDLRRTAASGMAALGFPVHVVEKTLNHISGTISGVAAVYNRHQYMDDRRKALTAWGRHVETLVEGRPANVVKLAGRT